MEIDASQRGLGAVLSQDQKGQIRPIAFASRSLRPSETNMSNYSSMKLELLALKWSVTEKFREYLMGNKFVVYTDNNPLSYLQTAKLAAIEQLWASQLALFFFFVINNFFFFFFTQHNRISKIKQNKTADTYSTSQGSIKREGEREGQQEHKSHSFK